MNHPSVSVEQVDAAIKSCYFFTAADGVAGAYIKDGVPPGMPPEEVPAYLLNQPEPLKLLTFCVLVLQNGFTVVGQSACAHPLNFDAEIGRNIAFRDANAKVWPLLGYELRTKLSQEAAL
jgi:hypothetical protein